MENKFKNGKFNHIFYWLTQTLAGLGILFYFIWFWCDMNFISKGLTLEGETIFDWHIVFDQHWYDVSIGLNIALLAIVGALLVANVWHLVATAFKFKENKGQAIFKIVTDLCVIGCALGYLCGLPSFISSNQYVFGLADNFELKHMDVINLATLALVASLFSFIMHWSRNKAFDANVAINDYSWTIKIAGFIALALLPFFIWKILPVEFFNEDLNQNWSNVIAECLTIPINFLNAIQFILLFALVVIYAYQHTQLKQHRTIQLALFGSFFALIMGMFIANHAIAIDFAKIIDYEEVKKSWKVPFAMNFIQVILGAGASVCLFFKFKKPENKVFSDIYND